MPSWGRLALSPAKEGCPGREGIPGKGRVFTIFRGHFPHRIFCLSRFELKKKKSVRFSTVKTHTWYEVFAHSQ